VNEVSFCARPHHRVHRTLGVDARATGPRWRVDSIEGSEVGGGGKRVEKKKRKISATKSLMCDCFVIVIIYFEIILVWYYWYRLVIF
jgi:hypothetical protein